MEKSKSVSSFFKSFTDRFKRPFRNVVAYARLNRDARIQRVIFRADRDAKTKAGSQSTPYTKRGKQSRPLKPFAGMTVELRKVEGKKKAIRTRVLAATDSTPNRFTFARFTNGKRRPNIKRLVNGHFEYLPQYK